MSFVDDFLSGLTDFQRKLRRHGCDYHLRQPAVQFTSQGQWSSLYWRADVELPSGKRLEISESHKRSRFRHTRKVRYRYSDSSGEQICLIDSHDGFIDMSECPHLHIGPHGGQRYEDGHWQLGDLSLQDFSVRKMWDIVSAHERDGRLPWLPIE